LSNRGAVLVCGCWWQRGFVGQQGLPLTGQSLWSAGGWGVSSSISTWGAAGNAAGRGGTRPSIRSVEFQFDTGAAAGDAAGRDGTRPSIRECRVPSRHSGRASAGIDDDLAHRLAAGQGGQRGFVLIQREGLGYQRLELAFAVPLEHLSEGVQVGLG